MFVLNKYKQKDKAVWYKKPLLNSKGYNELFFYVVLLRLQAFALLVSFETLSFVLSCLASVLVIISEFNYNRKNIYKNTFQLINITLYRKYGLKKVQFVKQLFYVVIYM